jgi:hypothetical protein
MNSFAVILLFFPWQAGWWTNPHDPPREIPIACQNGTAIPSGRYSSQSFDLKKLAEDLIFCGTVLYLNKKFNKESDALAPFEFFPECRMIKKCFPLAWLPGI